MEWKGDYMKSIIFINCCFLILFLGCNKINNQTSVLENTPKTIEYINTEQSHILSIIQDIVNESAIKSQFNNLIIQEYIFQILFENNKINEIIEFREFIEPQNRKIEDNKIKIAFNPVLMAIDLYPNTLNELFKKRPDLFLVGHDIQPGLLSVSPIIYIFRSNKSNLNNKRKALTFFFDNEIEWEKSIELYGTRNKGGREHLFAGSLLTESEDRYFQDYLMGKGFYTEEDISNINIEILSKGCNVYESPGFGNKVIYRIENNIKIDPIKITLYKKDSYQWINVMYNENDYGWIAQDKNLSYDTGI